jgi:HAMP domain-containing protein
MGLRLKFNVYLGAILLVGLLVFSFQGHRILQQNALDEVMHTANLMIESALAMRSYTATNIKPLLEPRLELEFLPQSVSAFAATQAMAEIKKSYPEYTYKEAAINPTNLRDRAADWEADLINAFRSAPTTPFISGERGAGEARTLYVARPIQIKNPQCLVCHSTPGAAPSSMIRIYGEASGFGWNLNEIIGAQIVTIPMSVPLKKADTAFYAFVSFLFGVFVLIFVALHIMLSHFVLKPLERMGKTANEISTGNLNVPELDESGRDEVSKLAVVFNRMMRSLKKAMQMLERQ